MNDLVLVDFCFQLLFSYFELISHFLKVFFGDTGTPDSPAGLLGLALVFLFVL